MILRFAQNDKGKVGALASDHTSDHMKQRLDIALVERGLVETRARAQALLWRARCWWMGGALTRRATPVRTKAAIEVKSGLPYVSRGGLKLAHALDVFGLRGRVAGKVALDIGASTGGFTDVLLQAGAARCMRWTWARTSLRGSCAPTRAWWRWSRPIFATCPTPANSMNAGAATWRPPMSPLSGSRSSRLRP